MPPALAIHAAAPRGRSQDRRRDADSIRDGNADTDDSADADGDTHQRGVMRATNALLARLGFSARSFADFDDLVASVSSMSVALYERLFQLRLDGIVRMPASAADYERNAQVVVDALAAAVLDEQEAEVESHIDQDDDGEDARLTGKRLCEGHVPSLQRLVSKFQHIYELLYEEESSSAALVDDDTHADERVAALRSSRHARGPNAKSKTRATSNTRSTTRRGARIPTSTGADRMTSKTRSGSGRAKETRGALSGKTPTLERSGSRASSEAFEDEADAQTRRYGRFVPVASSHGDKVEREEEEQDVQDDDQEYSAWTGQRGHEHHQEGDSALLPHEAAYFEGMSSVSGASGSDASVHYIDEDDEWSSQAFSRLQSHSSPDTNYSPDIKDSSASKARTNEQASELPVPEDDEELFRTPVQTSRSRVSKRTVTPRRSAKRTSKSPNPQTKASLYPPTPLTSRAAQTSRAQTELLRYKLQLKDHLQALRQRELDQQQHLERAYRLGEHAANVERMRARRLEQQLRMQRAAIGLQTKQQEERQLREALQQMLRLERDCLRDERRTTAQKLKQIQHEHEERETAMEQYYATQMQMIQEQTQRERKERQVVEQAHRLASARLVRELRHEREQQVAAALDKQQHMAEVRRFRHESQLTRAIEQGSASAKTVQPRTDAFYTAAMKARELRKGKKEQPPQPRSSTQRNSRPRRQ